MRNHGSLALRRSGTENEKRPAMGPNRSLEGDGRPSHLPARSRRAGLVPVQGRPRTGDLRRQGVEPPPAALELLPRPPQHAPAHGADGRHGGDGGMDRGAQRGRGADARVLADQAAPAALQRPPAGRQELSVPGRDGRRAVASGARDAGAQAQGRPLLRAVRPRLCDPGHARRAAAHVPDPHVLPGKFSQHQKLGRPCLLFHIEKCSGPCVGEIEEMPYRQLVATSATSSTATPRDRQPARRRDARRRRPRSSSSAPLGCATA